MGDGHGGDGKRRMTANWANQTVWTGDNLYIMRGMNSASVDLIYLDPPFNSKANYAAPVGSKAAGAAFKDTWTLSDVDAEWVNLMEAKHPALHRVLLAAMTPSDKSYLAYMAVRLLEMRRLLKVTGSIYLHCDPTMGHALKLLMDAIFGKAQFRSDIVWKRASAHRDTKQGRRQHGRIHDMILYYTAGKAWTWNPIYTPYSDEYLSRKYRHVTVDERRFKDTDLTAAKPGGDTEYDWHVKRLRGGGWEASIQGEQHAPLTGREHKTIKPPEGRFWAYSLDNMKRLSMEGRIYHTKAGTPRLIQFA